MGKMFLFDIFSGIGGMSLGFEESGMQTIGFCEINRQCRELLQGCWPGIPIFNDITKTDEIIRGLKTKPDIIAGGDPCPVRSRARGNRKSRHPDLSGYFLALVGSLRPGWVVRENVLASDDKDFVLALELLGYRTIIIRANSFPLTAQNRTRDFIVGCNQKETFRYLLQGLESQDGDWIDKKGNSPKAGHPCLTTHRCRYDSRDGYLWDGEHFRLKDKEETCKLAGFPAGWLDGFSETASARAFGNAVTPGIAFKLGVNIMQAFNEGC